MSAGRENVYATLFGTTTEKPPQPTGKGLLSLVANPATLSYGWNAGSTPTSNQPFRYAARRKTALGGAGIESYPAIYLMEIGERYDRSLMLGPPKITFISHVQIESASGSDINVISATELNNLADLVEDVVETTLYDNSLDGLALVSRITGREVVDVASQSGRFSVQVFEVETIVSH